MKVALKKWGWRLLRVAVIAAALFYVIWNVHWHDFATLADGKTTVRAYGQSEDGTRILADFDNDGTPEEHAAKEFSRPKSKDPKQVLPIVVPGLRTVLHETRWGYVVVALAIFAPNYVFMAWRLRLLLRTQGVYLRRRDAVKVSYASAFLNFAVPTGSTGGDIYKAWYVAAHATGRRTEAARCSSSSGRWQTGQLEPASVSWVKRALISSISTFSCLFCSSSRAASSFISARV